MAQAVRRRPFTVEVQVRSRVSPCETCFPPRCWWDLRSSGMLRGVVRWTLGGVFLRVLLFCPVSIHSANALNSSSSMNFALFGGITQRRMVILYRRFGTAYWSHLQGSRIPRRRKLTNQPTNHPTKELTKGGDVPLSYHSCVLTHRWARGEGGVSRAVPRPF
jgi:hypothetical protein